jgi:hypothetical protein
LLLKDWRETTECDDNWQTLQTTTISSTRQQFLDNAQWYHSARSQAEEERGAQTTMAEHLAAVRRHAADDCVCGALATGNPCVCEVDDAVAAADAAMLRDLRLIDESLDVNIARDDLLFGLPMQADCRDGDIAAALMGTPLANVAESTKRMFALSANVVFHVDSFVYVCLVALEGATEQQQQQQQQQHTSTNHRPLSVTISSTNNNNNNNNNTISDWESNNYIADYPTINDIAEARGLNALQRIAFEMLATTLLARLASQSNEFCRVPYADINVVPSPALAESSPTHVPTQSLMILTGAAGTGKSHVIRAVRELAARHNARTAVVVLAFTAAAAIKVGGQTFHSFLGLSANTSFRARQAACVKSAQKPLHNIKLLIFEEVCIVCSLCFCFLYKA